MNNKIESLQILRAVAAILVVLNHLWGTSNTTISNALGLDFLGGFGVDAFFILSGFIMCYTTSEKSSGGIKEATRFFIKRIERIYPIFLIVSSPFIIYYIISGKGFSLYQVVGNLLLLPSINNNPDYHIFVFPAWTLVYEMLFYVIYSISILVAKSKNQIITISSIAIVSTVVLVNAFSFNGPRLQWVNLSFMIGDPLMIDFVAGCIYAVIYKKINNMKISGTYGTSLIIGLFLFGVFMQVHSVPRLLSFGLTSLAIVILFSLIKEGSGKFWNAAVYLGNASYSIYITHCLFYYIRSLLNKHTNLNLDISGAIITLVAIVFGCLFYSQVEKRVTRWIKNAIILRSVNS